jgi:ribosomal protein L24E
MKVYVYQDGADFYVCSDKDCQDTIRIVTAPMKVSDFDLEAATKAREWFNEYGYFKGAWEVTFVPVTSEGF